MGVYLEAARLIHSGKESCACPAVDEAAQRFLGPERRWFALLFSPGDYTDLHSKWGDEWGSNRKQCRILALCLMAAIAGESA